MRTDGVRRVARPALGAAALLAGGLAGSTPLNERGAVVAHAQAAAMPRRLFISGHSLTAPPFPDYLAQSIEASGRRFDWDMQHQFGSSLRERTRGADGKASGYRAGTDRHGERADVLGAFETSGAAPYDTLLLAEQHSLLESLLWKDMVPSAGDFIARFRAQHGDGTVLLFASWLNIADRADPSRWIAYERAAGTAWRCVAALIARRTGVPVRVVPAGEALADLIGREPSLVPAIFSDDVHLTAAGSYYTALVTHGAMLGAPLSDNVQSPEGITPALANRLRQAARAFLSEAAPPTPDAAGCRAYLADRFAPHYLAYVRDARWRQSDGWRAYAKWLRFRIAWPRLLRSNSPDNPFAANQERA